MDKALELANELDNMLKAIGLTDNRVPTMLRQQQAEIEALKKETALQRLSDFTQEADNEPVAWVALNELNGSYSAFTNGQKNAMLPHISQLYGKWIPLYTHPTKTLTDEEIIKLFDSYEFSDEGVVEFAHELLRKAQENG